jgi:hypothetical protein
VVGFRILAPSGLTGFPRTSPSTVGLAERVVVPDGGRRSDLQQAGFQATSGTAPVATQKTAPPGWVVGVGRRAGAEPQA